MFVGLVLAQRYELIEKLGAGGMGAVWRAHDRTLNAEVAVKLIDPDFVESPTALARFRREAQAAAAIRSTHVVQILDHGVDGGTPFIAMELLKGESLAQRLRKVGHLAPELTARLLGQVARALALAHEQGIVHRDLKPDNIFLVREDEDLAKVLDFGVARKDDNLGDTDGLKTRTAAILGTPYYKSPEQATAQTVDHLADIWSFGVIACECLTGKRIFTGDSIGGLFHSICIAAMPVPSQLCSVPPGFDEWFARAAERNKSARFQSMKEAADELRKVCTGHPSLAEAVDVPPESALSISVSLGDPLMLDTAVQTTDPSSTSISTTQSRSGSRARVLIFVAATFLAGFILVTWRWLSRPTPSGSTASTVSDRAMSLHPAQQSAVAASPMPSVSPSSALKDSPIVPDAKTPLGENTQKAAVRKASTSTAGKRALPSPPSPQASANGHVNKRVTDDNAAGI